MQIFMVEENQKKLFGEVLKRHPEYRKQMIIQTKCGIIPGKEYDFSKEHILKCVNESIRKITYRLCRYSFAS